MHVTRSKTLELELGLNNAQQHWQDFVMRVYKRPSTKKLNTYMTKVGTGVETEPKYMHMA